MTRKVIYLLFFMLAQSAFAQEEDVHTVQNTEETSLEEIVKMNRFVMYFQPWCRYSIAFRPIWEELAEMFNKDKQRHLKIEMVDCSIRKSVCSHEDINEYPTLKFFKSGESKGTTFRGTRDKPKLIAFIDEQLGNTPKVDDE